MDQSTALAVIENKLTCLKIVLGKFISDNKVLHWTVKDMICTEKSFSNENDNSM